MFGKFCTGALLFISLWGIIFMAILGGLYYNESVGLFENLPSEAKSLEQKDWNSVRIPAIKKLYKQNAYNCWVACGVYTGMALLLSFRFCCVMKR